MADNENHLKVAFLSQYNLIALGGAAVLSLAVMNPVPLLVAAGAELVYLGTVPSLPGFKRRIRRRQEAERRLEEQRLIEQMVEELSANQREYYYALRDLRDQVLSNYGRIPGGKTLVESSATRIGTLLVSFVRLLTTLNNYRRYLNSTDRKALERELAELQAESSRGGGEKLTEIRTRRLSILAQRLERFDRAAESRELVSHQLASIEDFMRLLHEQSITLRDPEEVGAQLDHLSVEIQGTEETVRQMEQFMSFAEELNPITPPERQRVRGG